MSSSSNVAISNEQVTGALRSITEPEMNQSIVDLKMVSSIDVADDHVSLSMEAPTHLYGAKADLEEQVRAALTAMPGIETVDISWKTHVRASSGGRSDAQPIKGVKNTVAVASGKGGVGKSTVAVNLAVTLARAGATVGLLDADVYGPSMPLMMGVHDKPLMRANKMVPLEAHDVHVMSIGFLLDPQKALIWRGPLVAQLINQFINDVDWGELDYLIIDLPPGTGDVQLTLVQKIPISGAVIVTTPQDVALADAIKGLKMFEEVKTPILGIIENMSGFVCPSCREIHDIFGSGGGARVAQEHNVPLLGTIPIEAAVREGGDNGQPVSVSHPDSVTAGAFANAAGRVAFRLAAEAARKPRKPTIMLRSMA